MWTRGIVRWGVDHGVGRFIFIILACSALGAGEPVTIVVPNGYQCAEGDGSAETGRTAVGKRWQAIVSAHQLESLRDRGPMKLTSIAFRPDGAWANATAFTFPGYRVVVSTTQRRPCDPGNPDRVSCLADQFELNHGEDRKVVYEGDLPKSTANQRDPECGAGGPKMFDWISGFQEGFEYEYGEDRNLLVEVAYSSVQGSLWLDWQTSSETMFVWCANRESLVACWSGDTGPRLPGSPVMQFTFEPVETPPREFLRGDPNDDGKADISDAVRILNWLFLGSPEPRCKAAANVNGDDAADADISDPVYLLNFLFLGAPAPPEPYPYCGPGDLPADKVLGCETYLSCP